ncbi:hypothetical protein, partial [Pseudomonas sp. RTS4]|uniref:hypothetical protein n=1 Tax=Pseudomonas sp. RTS4 TaxID=3048644 RepID=UPI002B22442A
IQFDGSHCQRSLCDWKLKQKVAGKCGVLQEASLYAFHVSEPAKDNDIWRIQGAQHYTFLAVGLRSNL